VARLGWKKDSPPTKATAKKQARSILNPDTGRSGVMTSADSPSPESLPATPIIPSSTGSLYDELKLSTVTSSPVPAKVENTGSGSHSLASVSSSRPCYRCISYMHSVGIKRVFWTNSKGEWDGGKVRDLVDALELSGSSPDTSDGDGCGINGGASGGATGNGVFVTKHEVLMLRRLMGS